MPRFSGMEADVAEDPHDWELETQAVRGGMARSPYGEISEALFLTQSFAYESAEAADERFGGGPGFIYQRFGNPTTQIFEDRLVDQLAGSRQKVRDRVEQCVRDAVTADAVRGILAQSFQKTEATSYADLSEQLKTCR